MRFSHIIGSVVLALALATAVGCATEAEEGLGATGDAITGSVQGARIARVKQAYIDAKIEDFTAIEPLLDAAVIAAWNVDASDVHWFSLNVDGRVVYLVDVFADANAMMTGAPASAANPHESFVLVFDVMGDGTMGAILLYRADKNTWENLTRPFLNAHPRTPSADGGVSLPDGGSHSSEGGAFHADGGDAG